MKADGSLSANQGLVMNNGDFAIGPVVFLAWIVVALYGIVPLLVFATNRMEPRKKLEEFDPDDPDLSARFTREAKLTRQALEALGFELLSGLFLPSITKQVKLIVLLFTNRQSNVGATINLVYLNRSRGNNWKLRQQFVMYTSRFRDGTAIATLHSKDLSAFPPRPRVLVTNLPTKLPPSRLLAIHQGLQRRLTSSAPYSRIEEEFGGDVLKAFATQVNEEFSDFVTAGYLRPPREDVYRFTLKGAFLVIWKQFWPWGWIRRLQARAYERQLLEEFAAELPMEEN